MGLFLDVSDDLNGFFAFEGACFALEFPYASDFDFQGFLDVLFRRYDVANGQIEQIDGSNGRVSQADDQFDAGGA